MSKKNDNLAIFIAIVLIVFGFVASVSILFTDEDNPNGLKQFESAEEFEDYTSSSKEYFNPVRPTPEMPPVDRQSSYRDDSSTSHSTSQTNVQIPGIDEPDNVKITVGAAYYSPEKRYYGISQSFIGVDTILPPPSELNRTTRVIDTNNTEEPDIVGEISQEGKMLKGEDTLIIYNQERIAGYDISEAENPVEKWNKELSLRTSVVTARMTEGTVFFVLNTRQSDCPVNPVGNKSVSCEDIYYPENLEQGKGVYSALSVDGESGEMQSQTTFVGSRQSTVYMTGSNMYIAYTQSSMLFDRFVEEELADVDVKKQFKEQVRKIEIDNLRSQYELRLEIRDIVTNKNKYFERTDESMKIIEAYQNFLADNQRDAHRTVITKLNITDVTGIEPSVAGSVPGRPLNQYSFDEHNGNLRVATTVQGNDVSQSMNDMYVLDESLDIEGSVKDMAEGQRVYAVRFIGDRGYIITFRQIDPLHIINIDNPEDPEEVGVVELPGFSDYLHQVSEDEIIGIGESQDRRAKVVLFEISDETEPVVSDSLVFEEEYSTEISEDYRAFLEDEKMGVYYIPAGEGVRVVEIDDGQIEQKALISTPSSSERVRIIGNDLYVFHDDGVMSVDRESYEVNKKLSFT